MEQPLLRTLHHNYRGRDWVDDALVHLCNNGLHAEVHHFRKLQEELKHKIKEVQTLEDRIADIYLELQPCIQQLHRDEAMEQVKGQ